MDYYFPSTNLNSSSFIASSSSSSLPNNNNSSNSNSNGKEKKKGGGGKKGKGAVKLSTDPQSVAARERRHRISDRFKILQSMVPGGTKMDTVSMLDEAIHYVKFLKTQIWLHQSMINSSADDHSSSLFFAANSNFPAQGNNNNNIYAASVSTTNYLNPATVMHPTQLLPLPDSCFQVDTKPMPFDECGC